ncbi:MAG: amino acid permease [Planctomycetota bacterium]|nr:amino acid permease [Planctomycetota bacterium]
MDQDTATLARMGYRQELARSMGGFSNYAISLSIICILAGGITSFHLGFSAAGGAAIGLGWPIGTLLSLAFACTMAQIASAFPTAGGLYHWAALLGGRGYGWLTGWFNLFGLITVLAAINVGTFLFIRNAMLPALGIDAALLPAAAQEWLQIFGVAAITISQALINHLGIKVTTRLTDFSGVLILIVATVLTVSLLVAAPALDFSRLVTFANNSGLPKSAPVWPRGESIGWLFLLGLMLPAYTITGFDASAHTSEETIAASRNVPRGIVRSVLVSGVFGYAMLCAIVLAMPDLNQAAQQGDQVVFWTISKTLNTSLATTLYIGIAIAQYLCGLATVTSASRMAYAFARDGGLPMSQYLKRISKTRRTPAVAIWVVAVLVIAFTLYTPVYSTITTVCVIFLYLSYLLPTVLGLCAIGKTWTQFGPWTLGGYFRLLAVVCIVGAGLLLLIGVQPPNEKALYLVALALSFAVVAWYGLERRRFRGPPSMLAAKHATPPGPDFDRA